MFQQLSFILFLIIITPQMLNWKRVLALSTLSITSYSYYQYHNSHSFRSIANLAYAGTHMAMIYKYGNQPTLEDKHISAGQYLRDALLKNGGIYLKLGQLIATLDVIVPDQYRNVMGTLTRECKKTSFQDTKATIEEDMGYPLDVVFRQFESTPISSASIAQVHKARLLNGEQVAVKIQHRELASQVESDLSMMHTFVKVAKFIFQEFHYEWLVQGFQKNIRIELDFNIQACNMIRTDHFLRQNNFKDIYIPKLLLKPSRRVLIMQFIHGIHLDQLQKLREKKINTKKIGTLFAKMIIKMIHKEGFVHADPHSGNLMARKHKGKDQLVILDHGLYQELDRALLRNYNQFWLGIILNEPNHYQKAGRALGTTNPKMLRSMLTSMTDSELNSKGRNTFALNPSKDRVKIMAEAAKNHSKIISVLQEMKREVLLLMKVNEFARSIENMLSGRELGVYEDIARQCVQNMGFPWYQRWGYYFQMWLANR